MKMRWGGYNARAAERAKAVVVCVCLFAVAVAGLSALAVLLPITR